MTTAAVHGFDETAPQAEALARELGIPCRRVAVHRFPDGESLVRVEPSPPTALLYRSLDNANAKLVELLLTTSALRANGASRVILIAPYLGYMRQDRAFRPGEAVSQQVIGRLLAERFDALLTLDPHLHRTRSLSQVVPGIDVAALSAAPALMAALDLSERPLLVGPDVESRQWLAVIAAPLELEILLGEKVRGADREVTIDFPDIARCAGRAVVLIDDVISSGGTMAAAAERVLAAGAAKVEALATHCLASAADLESLRQAGIARIRATDSVPGPVSAIAVAPLIAREIRQRGWIKDKR